MDRIKDGTRPIDFEVNSMSSKKIIRPGVGRKAEVKKMVSGWWIVIKDQTGLVTEAYNMDYVVSMRFVKK